MARLDHDGLWLLRWRSTGLKLIRQAKPTWCAKGALLIAADPKSFKAIFKKAKKMPGYKWVVINKVDIFAANPFLWVRRPESLMRLATC